MTKDKEGRVGARGGKVDADGELGEAIKPRLRGLMEAVEGFVEKTDGVGSGSIDKPSGLLIEDVFL